MVVTVCPSNAGVFLLWVCTVCAVSNGCDRRAPFDQPLMLCSVLLYAILLLFSTRELG